MKKMKEVFNEHISSKNNMYQSYSSCGILENNLSQLISILNRVDITTHVVSQYVSTLISLNTVKEILKECYK